MLNFKILGYAQLKNVIDTHYGYEELRALTTKKQFLAALHYKSYLLMYLLGDNKETEVPLIIFREEFVKHYNPKNDSSEQVMYSLIYHSYKNCNFVTVKKWRGRIYVKI